MNTINNKFEIGDLVFSIPQDEYGCLVGKVIEITKLGSPEHDTENMTDDIHVDFFTPYHLLYSDNRKNEIAKEFSELYGEPKKYDELPLDDVIMSPESLVNLNGIDNWTMEKIMSSREQAESYYENYLSEHHNELHAELIKRIGRNLVEYREFIMGFDKKEIIEMADKISSMADAYDYMTIYHKCDIDELNFYLQFQNPLELIADEWLSRNDDISEMVYTMEHINERRDYFSDLYPLMADKVSKTNELPEKTEQIVIKPKTLEDKINAAKEKVKTQETKNNSIKSQKWEERN